MSRRASTRRPARWRAWRLTRTPRSPSTARRSASSWHRDRSCAGSWRSSTSASPTGTRRTRGPRPRSSTKCRCARRATRSTRPDPCWSSAGRRASPVPRASRPGRRSAPTRGTSPSLRLAPPFRCSRHSCSRPSSGRSRTSGTPSAVPVHWRSGPASVGRMRPRRSSAGYSKKRICPPSSMPTRCSSSLRSRVTPLPSSRRIPASWRACSTSSRRGSTRTGSRRSGGPSSGSPASCC